MTFNVSIGFLTEEQTPIFGEGQWLQVQLKHYQVAWKDLDFIIVDTSWNWELN